MPNDSMRVQELSVRYQVGTDEAEGILRVQARNDPAAAAEVKRIDQTRTDAAAAARRDYETHAKALGLSTAQAQDLIFTLATNPALLTWLSGRVHRTIGQGGPLGLDE